MAFLLLLLQAVDYWLLLKTTRLELYVGFLALIFIGVGVWFGIAVSRTKTAPLQKEQRLNSPDQFNISTREFEILQLLATGMTNHEIATTLFISVNTVKTHVASLYNKLDVRRRTQAISKARELHLLN